MSSLEIAREMAHSIVAKEAKKAGLGYYSKPVIKKTKKRKVHPRDKKRRYIKRAPTNLAPQNTVTIETGADAIIIAQ